MNADCGEAAPCDEVATAFGACADCHAPGIDGQLGGRDLLEATDHAYDYGVHCDVCHKVESVDLEAEAGVAGRLQILRPIEESPSTTLGEWYPLTFGPYYDVINPRMGSVQRDLYHEATICAGCHQLDQPVLVAGAQIDLARWPDGRIPVHSTYAEWEAGPMNPGAPCQSCHMPPDAESGNSSGLGDDEVAPDAQPGLSSGWYRPPGSVRHHMWTGPRYPGERMLELAASLAIDAAVVEGELVAQVTTRNVGPGHAIPTGEPLRSLLLLVEARCGERDLAPPSPPAGRAIGPSNSSWSWARKNWPPLRSATDSRSSTSTGKASCVW